MLAARTLFLCLLPFAPLIAEGAFSNRRAPGFSLPDATMTQHDPQDYRGKVLLLEFMKTQCPICKVMSGVLEQMKAKYPGQVSVLSVVIMPDTIDSVRAYIKDNGITSPILFDSGQMAASYLKITPQNPTLKFPHIFLIDPDGIIRNDFDHDDAERKMVTAPRLSAEIEKLLKGAPAKKR